MLITKEYLQRNPNHIFVFGDNFLRKGFAGAALLRKEPNTYGFVTKKYPSNEDKSFFKPEEYREIFLKELQKLELEIKKTPNNLWLISPIGSGLANKYNIWEKIIKPEVTKLTDRHNNIRLLF